MLRKKMTMIMMMTNDGDDDGDDYGEKLPAKGSKGNNDDNKMTMTLTMMTIAIMGRNCQQSRKMIQIPAAMMITTMPIMMLKTAMEKMKELIWHQPPYHSTASTCGCLPTPSLGAGITSF